MTLGPQLASLSGGGFGDMDTPAEGRMSLETGLGMNILEPLPVLSFCLVFVVGSQLSAPEPSLPTMTDSFHPETISQNRLPFHALFVVFYHKNQRSHS